MEGLGTQTTMVIPTMETLLLADYLSMLLYIKVCMKILWECIVDGKARVRVQDARVSGLAPSADSFVCFRTLNPKTLNPKILDPKPLNPKTLNPKPQNPRP